MATLAVIGRRGDSAAAAACRAGHSACLHWFLLLLYLADNEHMLFKLARESQHQQHCVPRSLRDVCIHP